MQTDAFVFDETRSNITHLQYVIKRSFLLNGDSEAVRQVEQLVKLERKKQLMWTRYFYTTRRFEVVADQEQ